MKKHALRALAAFAALALALAPRAARAEDKKDRPKPQVEFKIASLAPEGSTFANVMKDAEGEVYDATGGAVGCKFYFGGVAGDEKDVLKKVRINQYHGGAFSGVGLGEVAPAVRVMEMPFAFKTYEEVDAVYKALEPDFEKEYDKAGFALLGGAEQGYIYILSANELKTVADIRKSKVWLWEGDPLATAIFEAFEISPISLAVPDVLTSLQTGLVDTVYASPLLAVALQWFTKVKYMLDFPITNGTGAIVVSKKMWAKVSPENQAKVREIVGRHTQRLKERTRKENLEAIESMKKNGVRVLSVPQDQLPEYERIGIAASKSLVGKLYPQAFYDKAMAAAAEHRKSKAK